MSNVTFFVILYMVTYMYDVTINDFNGPMDLLLHLIKQSKMNIFDLKLEVIIDEYLNYINSQAELNLNIASSYLVMASELLEIKSKMLLPHDTDSEEEEEDPKEQLINRLIEYQRYKEQVDKFKELEYSRNLYYTKIPSNISDYQVDEKKIMIENITLNDLVNAFKNFLDRAKLDEPVSTKVTKKEYSVEDSMKSIRTKLKKGVKVDFFSLFEKKTKSYIVVTFLAILELAKSHELLISQDNKTKEIRLEAI